MTGYDSKRKIAMDRLDDDDIQIYAQPEGKIMTEEEARTLEAMKYAASMGYPSSMLKDMFAPFTLKRDVTVTQPAQEEKVAGVAYVDDLDLWHFCPLQETENFPAGTKFYTTPQPRPGVGLTDEEMEATFIECGGKWNGDYWRIEDADFHPFLRTIEAKLKGNK